MSTYEVTSPIMSTSPGSRAQLTAQQGPTLADLRTRISGDPSLTARKREEVLSALNTLARTMGRRLEEIPAHPKFLGKQVRGLTSAMAGTSQSRWSNVVSL